MKLLTLPQLRVSNNTGFLVSDRFWSLVSPRRFHTHGAHPAALGRYILLLSYRGGHVWGEFAMCAWLLYGVLRVRKRSYIAGRMFVSVRINFGNKSIDVIGVVWEAAVFFEGCEILSKRRSFSNRIMNSASVPGCVAIM